MAIKDLLVQILKKLGFALVSEFENGDENVLIAGNNSKGGQVKVRIRKICDTRLGTILLPKVKVEISGLSRKEEELFNELLMISRGGG